MGGGANDYMVVSTVFLFTPSLQDGVFCYLGVMWPNTLKSEREIVMKQAH
jgi:hypothetical protein